MTSSTTQQSFRIGNSLDRALVSQVVAPLTCCLLSAFDRIDVPVRFRTLRDSINDVKVTMYDYIRELVKLLLRVPLMISVDSVLLSQIATRIEGTVCDSARMYVLAYLIPKADAYHALSDRGPHLQTFMEVAAGIRANRERATARIDLILQALLRLEIEDRAFVVFRTIDAPFFFEKGNETAVLALAHYHPEFVTEFKKTVRPFVRSLDRAHELVKIDFNVFTAALSRVPPTSDITSRLERILFPEETEAHPEAGRIAWAFCSTWFTHCLDTYRSCWNLSPESLKRMYSLSKQGKTITLLEATRPFGSIGTNLLLPPIES